MDIRLRNHQRNHLANPRFSRHGGLRVNLHLNQQESRQVNLRLNQQGDHQVNQLDIRLDNHPRNPLVNRHLSHQLSLFTALVVNQLDCQHLNQ